MRLALTRPLANSNLRASDPTTEISVPPRALTRRNRAATHRLLMAAFVVAIAVPPAIGMGTAVADDDNHQGRETRATDTQKSDGSMWYSIRKTAVLAAVARSLCRETTSVGVVILRGTPCSPEPR